MHTDKGKNLRITTTYISSMLVRLLPIFIVNIKEEIKKHPEKLPFLKLGGERIGV